MLQKESCSPLSIYMSGYRAQGLADQQPCKTLLQVKAVVVGHDRNINYHKIQYATLCIRENPGCHFIATNLDAVTHLTDAQVRYSHQLLSMCRPEQLAHG